MTLSGRPLAALSSCRPRWRWAQQRRSPARSPLAAEPHCRSGATGGYPLPPQPWARGHPAWCWGAGRAGVPGDVPEPCLAAGACSPPLHAPNMSRMCHRHRGPVHCGAPRKGCGTAERAPAKCAVDGMQRGALPGELNPPAEFGRSWLVSFKGRKKDFKIVEMLPFGKAEFFKRAKPSVCPFRSLSCSGMRHRKELPKQHRDSA